MISLRESLISAKDWHKIDVSSNEIFEIDGHSILNDPSYSILMHGMDFYVRNDTNADLRKAIKKDFCGLSSKGLKVKGFAEGNNLKFMIYKGHKSVEFEEKSDGSIFINGNHIDVEHVPVDYSSYVYWDLNLIFDKWSK